MNMSGLLQGTSTTEKLLMQNGSGAYKRVQLSCTYDTQEKGFFDMG
jgi:hypothetical protein